MSSDVMAFRRLLRGDGNGKLPSRDEVIAWVKEHPVLLGETDDTFGGVLNNTIGSKLPANEKLTIMRALVELGAPPEGGPGFRSPLSHAAHEGEVNLVAYLLTKIPVPSEWSGEDDPMIAAIVNGSLDIVKMLVASGMNPSARKGKRSLVEIAEEWGRHDIVQFLRESAGLGSRPKTTSTMAPELEERFGAIQRSVSHTLLGVSVSLTGSALITSGCGGESKGGLRVELFMEVEPGVELEDWPLKFMLTAVDELRSGRSKATDLGEIVAIPNGSGTSYSHLLLFEDAIMDHIQFFRVFPLYKKEADTVLRTGTRPLLERFQELGISVAAAAKRPSAF